MEDYRTLHAPLNVCFPEGLNPLFQDYPTCPHLSSSLFIERYYGIPKLLNLQEQIHSFP